MAKQRFGFERRTIDNRLFYCLVDRQAQRVVYRAGIAFWPDDMGGDDGHPANPEARKYIRELSRYLNRGFAA